MSNPKSKPIFDKKKYDKEYYQRNKKPRPKFTCEICKRELYLGHKKKHEKSKNHIRNKCLFEPLNDFIIS